MVKCWYVVYVYFGFEKYVMCILKECVVLNGMEDKFGEILVLIEEVVEMCEGKKCKSECKFYFGYVFVQMEMDDGMWYFVKNMLRVFGFIGGIKDKLVLIIECEVEVILCCVESGVEKLKLKMLFELGEIVCVIEGFFVDFNGVVEEVDYDKSWVKVVVLIFGCLILVELEFGQVEKD